MPGSRVSGDFAVVRGGGDGWKLTIYRMRAGTSSAALGVLTSVASEYLQNVGRTIRYLCDKYSKTMTAEVSLRLTRH
jgi:hypothetical protein